MRLVEQAAQSVVFVVFVFGISIFLRYLREIMICGICVICVTYLLTINKFTIMKIKLSKKQIESILEDPEKALATGVKTNDPWWIIVLKVVAYIIGLIVAGVATTGCASHIF